jgi:CheY-like chemotaxis protein
VENVVSLFEEQAAAHSVGFSLEFDEDLPQFVVGDPTRLRQVLVNLVGNAFKFTQHGSVRMRVERVPDDGAAEPHPLQRQRYRHRHRGGRHPAPVPAVRAGRRVDHAPLRRHRPGAGDLPPAGGADGRQHQCRQHAGRGQHLHVRTAAANGVAPPLVPHVPREPHSHQLKVLCAEDFPTNQIIIRMMLEDLGHKVDIAANGALAVKACSLTRYDLILMDGRMPEMDGASATRLIRSGGPDGAPVRDQELMIIALTANASEEDRSRYLAAGMDDFLTKPIDEDKLHFQLSRAIERQLQRGFQLPRMQPRRNPAAARRSSMPCSAWRRRRWSPRGWRSTAAAQRSEARLRSAFNQDAPLRLADLELRWRGASRRGRAAAAWPEGQRRLSGRAGIAGAVRRSGDGRRPRQLAAGGAAMPQLRACWRKALLARKVQSFVQDVASAGD